MSDPAEKAMSNLDGLGEFLKTGGNTLLIKGDAGSGKSTLALQLLRGLSGDGKGVYISARVSEEKLHKHNPSTSKMSQDSDQAGFVDLRLGNSGIVLAEMIKALKGKDREKVRAIVLDTWDSFAKELDEKERLKAEKTMMALADTTDARIIFVSEEPDKTTMEYLVDGIVVLRRLEERGMLLREFELTKLRGTPITQHKHLFTLEGGAFTAFDYYVRPDYSKASRPKARKDIGDSFSFGSEKLDSLFGGIPKGMTFAIEYEGNVHYSSLRMVEILPIINALNLGHSAFLLPLPSAPLQEIADLVRPFVSAKAFKENFAVASMERDDPQIKAPFYGIGADNDEELAKNITGLIEKVRKNSASGGVLTVESIVQLESTFASSSNTVLEGLSKRISRIQSGTNDALLVLLHSDARMKSRVLAMSRRYAKMLMKDRVTVVVGEKPSTEPYVLEHDEENPIYPRLTRIV